MCRTSVCGTCEGGGTHLEARAQQQTAAVFSIAPYLPALRQGHSELFLRTHLLKLWLQSRAAIPGFHGGVGDLNSGPHANKANALTHSVLVRVLFL